jgi:anion-transporting  ArsA/GET3 family ATPase
MADPAGEAARCGAGVNKTPPAGPTGGLLSRRLLIVAGKGGVGRTTVACALALAASRRGKRVLLAQTTSKNRLPQLFGVDRAFGEVQPVDSNLWAVNMTPEAAIREYGIMVLRSAFLYRQVLDRDIVKAFLRAIPGLYDYSMLGKVWYHTTEQVAGRPRFDLVVLDAPATGHALTLLAIPKVIIDTVPDGPLTGPARDCQQLLTDAARTQALLVTLAEDLPVTETIQLAQGLENLHITRGPLIVNRLYPPRFSTGFNGLALDELKSVGEGDVLYPVLRAARMQRQRARLNDQYVEKLRTSLPQPQLHLPYLFTSEVNRAAIDTLADRLGEQLDAMAFTASAKSA